MNLNFLLFVEIKFLPLHRTIPSARLEKSASDSTLIGMDFLQSSSFER